MAVHRSAGPRRALLPLLLGLVAGCPATDDTGVPDDTGDTADTSDTGDTADTSDTADTGDTADTSDTADTGDTDEPGPSPANWDFEDWTASNPPPGFTRYPDDASWSVLESDEPLAGDAAATLTWMSGTNDKLLQSTWRVVVPGGGVYTTHAWVLDDADGVAASLVVRTLSGSSQVAVLEGEATTDDAAWQALRQAVTIPASGVDGITLTLHLADSTDAVGLAIGTDAWAITEPVDLDPTDGEIDPETRVVAGTPGTTMDARAALDDQGVLHASTNWADQGSDHLLFTWIGGPHPSATVDPNWSKGGAVAAPAAGGALAVLVQEQSSKFCEWLVREDGDGTWRTVTDDSGCNGGDDGPRLEGSLDLVAALGLDGPEDLPATFAFAVAPWEDGDGVDGEIKADYQQPAGNGDTTLDAAETAEVSTPDLLAGRLVPVPIP